MTKTTIFKSATAPTEAAPSHPTSIVDSPKTLFASAQATVTTPQSTISKNPTFYTHTMSTILPTCISRLVTNRSQQTNGSQNHNNPIKHLMRSFALLFLLLGFNSTVHAQTGPNDDFDGDGIVNLLDIDDDNDGVVDAVESATCFFRANDWNTVNKSAFATVSTQLNMVSPNNALANLTDGIGGATGAVQFVTGQSALNKEIFKIELAVPTQVDAIYIQNNIATFNMISSLTMAGSIKVQGSNDNTAWTDVTAATTWPALATNVTANGAVSLTNSVKFPLTTNLGKYKYYRIYGVLGALTGQGIASEIYLDVNNATYQTSLYPNATCTVDTDGDTKLNHQDLDSDGDTCSDAKEAGATSSLTANFAFPTTGVGTNGLPNAVETVADNSTINYASTYTNYAVNALVNACTDTDNDGITDVIDIDDDNDGVLDSIEVPCIDNMPVVAPTTAGALADVPSLNTTLTYKAITGTQSLIIDGALAYGNSDVIQIPGVGSFSAEFSTPLANIDFTLADIDQSEAVYFKVFDKDNNLLIISSNDIMYNGTAVAFAPATGNSGSISTTSTDYPTNSLLNYIRFKFNSSTFIKRIEVYKTAGANNSWFAINGGCNLLDTDGDTIPNSLDSDSDGDGCSDAKEAGATTNTTANYAFTTAVGTNGLANSLETVADNGTINYISSYDFALANGINACSDFDTDGIPDLIDIDDDNDGVVDAVESPSCYFSANNWNTIAKSGIMSVTTQLNLLAPNTNVAALTDGNGTTAAVQFVTATVQSQLNKELLKLELYRPTQLDAIYVRKTTGVEVFGPAVNSLKVQGSNDDATWTDLTPAMTVPTGNVTHVTTNGAVTLTTTNKFPLTTNLAAYKYYRIYGVVNTNAAAGIISEIYADVNTTTYQASLYPTPTCTADIDTDNKLNHLDLDADGDGCSDAFEAGTTTNTTADFAFTGTMGANGLDNSLETTTDNGIYTGSYTYYFANSALVNACTDTDGDGIYDVKDIDDDNDGVNDCAEGITKPLNFATPAIFTDRNVDEAGTIQFSSENVLTGTQQLNAPGGDANGNISLAVKAGIGMQTGYNLSFTVPTSIRIGSKGISIGGYLTNDEYHEFNAGGQTMMVYDPANELDLWNGTAWIDMPDNFAGTTIRWRPKVNGTKFYFLIPDVTLFNWKFFNNHATFTNGTTINISRACIEQDTDGDGKVNNLDLDSDGDGCSDATEAGSSTTATSTTVYPTGADANTNGLLNTYENATLATFPNYTSTYDPDALSTNLAFCRDFDNDGILDINDVDDDNDGTLDVVESPACFFIKTDWNSKAKSDFVTVTSDIALLTNTNLAGLSDGLTANAVSFATAAAQLNKEIFKMTFAKPVQLDAFYINKSAATNLISGTNSIKVQGSNDNTTWTDLTAAITPPANASNTTAVGGVVLANSNKFTIAQNAAKYKYYRIYGVVAATTLAGVATEIYYDVNANYDGSMFPLAVCNSDTDKDGKFNYLDNDSDGDGCSDALESEATTNTATNYAFPANSVGVNGLSDDLETVADNAIINYTSKYINAVSNNIAYCADTDQDGISNTDDIDDDNDGILDAVESPTCFYSSNDWLQGDRPQILVSTQLAMAATQDQPNKLVNGTTSATNYDVRFVATTTGAPKEVFRFEMPTPVALSKIYLGYVNATTVFGAGTGITLKGSMDGTNWTNLSAQTTYAAGASLGAVPGIAGVTFASEFTVTQNAGKYRYYALVWTGGGSISASGYANEAYFKTDATYVPSMAPKPVCNNDSDGDGKPNHIDTDADGDGCADIVEAGVSTTVTATVLTGTVGANGFADAVETTPESNTYNGTYTYTIARDASVNACTDSDGDGTTNVNDLDDDNDGILDVVECPAPGFTPLTPKFNITSGASQSQTITGFPDELYIDIFSIDNNFSLNVNGTYITSVQEINLAWAGGLEYTAGSTWSTLPDGTFLGNGSPWTYGGTKPLLRVIINKFGDVKLMGLNQTTNTYQEMILRSASFNQVPINLTGTNTFTLDQDNQYSPTFANAEFNALYNSGFCDTDGDRIPNGLDLDSDGDGCFDAIEAKVLVSSTTGIVAGGYGANGLADSKETAAESGLYNATYFYNYALDNTVNFCKDSDNDGVSDVEDIDDDNDGIQDAIESPSCFYAFSEATKPIAVSTELDTYGKTNALYYMPGAIDNDAATFSAFNNTQDWVGKTIIEVEAPIYTAVTAVNFTIANAWALSSNATSTFKLQGSGDNIVWFDLSAAQASIATTGTLTVNNTLIPAGVYKYFRLVGVAGTNAYGGISNVTFSLPTPFNSSLYPKVTCNNDTDGDTIPNHLDLDSDGDGCTDAKEVFVTGTLTTGSVINRPTGATTNTTTTGAANAVAAGPYNTSNGFATALQTAGNGIYTGSYVYDYAINQGLNACTDTDNDGINDIKDIDDDNDGVLDAVESPTCFYNAQELSVPIAVSSEIPVYQGNATYTIENSIDGNSATSSAFVGSYNWVGKELFKFTAKTYMPITGMTFDLVSWALSSSTANTFKLQGSSDSVSWTDLSAASSSTATSNSYTISNTLNPTGKYKYFRILGVAGVSANGGVKQAVFNVASSVNQSEYPKASCFFDLDNDGKPNHLDLDSDGDGCSDAKEAGTTTSSTANFAFTGTMGTNGFDNSLEATADNGIYNSTYTYGYAKAANLSMCLDTDGDGAPDLLDIDDDNDGVLDKTEQTCTANTTPVDYYGATYWSSATWTGGYVSTASTNVIPAGLIDGNVTAGLTVFNPCSTCTAPVVPSIWRCFYR